MSDRGARFKCEDSTNAGRGKLHGLERVFNRFSSHDEAAQADREYYRRLTPARRLEILLELLEWHRPDADGAPQGLQRVYRIAKLESR